MMHLKDLTDWLLCCPLPIQPQERPHPQAPAQPFRDQLCPKGQVSLRKVPTLRRGSGEGRAPLAWSQSMWRWRVRGQREALNLLSVFWFSSFFCLSSFALYWILLCGPQLHIHTYTHTLTKWWGHAHVLNECLERKERKKLIIKGNWTVLVVLRKRILPCNAF